MVTEKMEHRKATADRANSKISAREGTSSWQISRSCCHRGDYNRAFINLCITILCPCILDTLFLSIIFLYFSSYIAIVGVLTATDKQQSFTPNVRAIDDLANDPLKTLIRICRLHRQHSLLRPRDHAHNCHLPASCYGNSTYICCYLLI